VEARERHGHLQLVAAVRAGLLAMSAATIDRVLRDLIRNPRDRCL
jgi:hydroxymethylglutaryl-CoA reductase